MIGKKLFVLALTSTVILTACGQSNESLESFYKKVEKANQKEKVIVELNEKMTSSEKDKVKKIEKLNKARGEDFKSTAKEITDGIKNREEIIDKEKKAMDESKEIFSSSNKDYKSIEGKEQQKEAKELKEALENKYKKHDKVVEGYKDILKAEKELFGYLSKNGATQEGADNRTKKLTEANKKIDEIVTDYQKQLQKVQSEKQDVSEIINK
nr:YkyA family protein [Mammaliicoccus sp. Marseille-Q6498]